MGRYIESDIDLGGGGGYHGCMDCGVIVYDPATHDRFHAILNYHGKTCALLAVAHIAPHVHDKYDVYEKIGKPKDSWSDDAFKEVTGLDAKPAHPNKDQPPKQEEA